MYRAFPDRLCGFCLPSSSSRTWKEAYYLTPIYPTLFGIRCGHITVEESWCTAPAGAELALRAGDGIAETIAAPMSIPILSRKRRSSPTAPWKWGLLRPQRRAEHQKLGTFAATLRRSAWLAGDGRAGQSAVYDALPPADRAKGDFPWRRLRPGGGDRYIVFGRPLGLPPAIGGHNNYFLWGPQGHDGSVLIVLGPYWGELLPAYAQVEIAGEINNPYAMPYETGPIYVLRNPKVPFSFIWPNLRHYE